jgi:hypothetical protein
MAKTRCHYNIMLRPEPEGGYTAGLRKHQDPIPTDDNILVTSLDLEYAEVTRR